MAWLTISPSDTGKSTRQQDTESAERALPQGHSRPFWSVSWIWFFHHQQKPGRTVKKTTREKTSKIYPPTNEFSKVTGYKWLKAILHKILTFLIIFPAEELSVFHLDYLFKEVVQLKYTALAKSIVELRIARNIRSSFDSASSSHNSTLNKMKHHALFTSMEPLSPSAPWVHLSSSMFSASLL